MHFAGSEWRCYIKRMDMIFRLSRRGAAAACIMLSACVAAGPSGAQDMTPADQAYGAFLAARYADAQHDPEAATKFYTRALQGDPGNQQLVSEGFLAALLAGSPQAGALAPQLPGNTLAELLQANQAALNGDYAQASQLYGGLPQDDLTGLIRPLLLAWAAFGQGNTQAALAALTPGFNNGSFGEVYVLNAALIADAAQDTKDAAQYYGQVDGSTPDLRLAEILASWQARQGNQTQAEATLDALAGAHPDLQIALPALRAQMAAPVISTAPQGLAEAYLTLAGSLDQPSQNFLRTTLLRFALQLRPDLSAARLLLASSLAGGDDPSATPSPVQMQNAMDALQPIAAGDVLYGPAALQEVNLLAALGRPGAAVSLLDGLIAMSPPDPGLLSDAGDILRAGNQNAAAIPYYTKAIALMGDPPPGGAWTLFFDRGICEDALDNWAAAEPDMLEALNLAPNQPYVLNYLGYSWALRGEKLEQARAMLEQAVGLDPNDGAVLDSLGYVNLREGRVQTALGLLKQAVELDPDDAEVNGHLGDAFWRAGEKLQADYQWRRALALQPDDKLKAAITAELQRDFPAQP